jgi:hypothetical protein
MRTVVVITLIMTMLVRSNFNQNKFQLFKFSERISLCFKDGDVIGHQHNIL